MGGDGGGLFFAAMGGGDKYLSSSHQTLS